MSVTSIELQLESENLVYFSGQRVKGALVLQIGLPVIIAGKCQLRVGHLKICQKKSYLYSNKVF